MMTQKYWRETKRTARKAIAPHERSIKNQQITHRVMASTHYQQAMHVGAYLSLPEEVDVNNIIAAAWAEEKKVYLPVVTKMGEALKFAPYEKETGLKKGCLGIAIPDVAKSQLVDATTLDVVITPLVAFDDKCNRIGMGGGFYDRTFAFKKNSPHASPVLIGVAFETQKIEAGLPTNDWDIQPDAIISEQYVYVG